MQLDYAKRHLTHTITSLRRLAMLTAAVDDLEQVRSGKRHMGGMVVLCYLRQRLWGLTSDEPIGTAGGVVVGPATGTAVAGSMLCHSRVLAGVAAATAEAAAAMPEEQGELHSSSADRATIG
jgi:hypothetical protein